MTQKTLCYYISMKIENIPINETISTAKALLKKEKNISPALRSIFNVLLLIVQVMVGRLRLNSKNSSKPPSSDPNKKKKKKSSSKKPGGQPGRTGVQLKPVDNPNTVKHLKIDRRKLPKGTYSEAPDEKRQVIDFAISIEITEYRAQVLLDGQGKRTVAEFPPFVKRPIQYGPKVKACSVYMSQFQLIPNARVIDYFTEQMGLNISAGSVFNFNQEAYRALEDFERISKERLLASPCLHADETGINVNGKRLWLHTVCSDKWTLFYPHSKRGSEAIEAMGVIPYFQGILCHDHWKPYYKYRCWHSLCNAHHLRELEWSAIEDHQKWAEKLQIFLRDLNETVKNAGGVLELQDSRDYHRCYRALLKKAEEECPLPEREVGQKGRMKKSKSRNLLERLRDFQEDTLRFMEDVHVPFTNNQGENDLRMTKVQQKISGCFRSMEGAQIFCRIRAYLITCRKHEVSATEALECLFAGRLPAFVKG